MVCDLDLEALAVLADGSHLELARFAGEGTADERLLRNDVVGWQVGREALADHLLARIAIHLEVSGVRIDHVEVCIPQADCVEGHVEDGAVLFLARCLVFDELENPFLVRGTSLRFELTKLRAPDLS